MQCYPCSWDFPPVLRPFWDLPIQRYRGQRVVWLRISDTFLGAEGVSWMMVTGKVPLTVELWQAIDKYGKKFPRSLLLLAAHPFSSPVSLKSCPLVGIKSPHVHANFSFSLQRHHSLYWERTRVLRSLWTNNRSRSCGQMLQYKGGPFARRSSSRSYQLLFYRVCFFHFS